MKPHKFQPREYKPSKFQLEQERIERVIVFIKSKGTASVRQIRNVMEWKPYLFEGTMKIIRKMFNLLILWKI